MIIINEKVENKLENLKSDDFYVVADFDKTISTQKSNSTFSLFAKSGFYGDEYKREREALYNHYRPLEVDPSIGDEEKRRLMDEWQMSSYRLMLKHQVRESDILRIISNYDLLELREGAIDFIRHLNELGVPIIISSAGIGNFIIELLKREDCYKDNVYVFSNVLKFQDDVIIDSIKSIIHSMNKYEMVLPEDYLRMIEGKRTAVVIGDNIADVNMVKTLDPKQTIKFGFLEENIEAQEALYREAFDVVLKDHESFDPIAKMLRLK